MWETIDFDEYLLGATDEIAKPLIQGTTTSLRSIGVLSIVLSLLWLLGWGSFAGFCVGLIGILLRNRVTESPVRGLALCWIGMSIGVLGLAATVVLFALR